MRGTGRKSGKKAMRCQAERRACPRRGHPEAAKASLHRRQTEEGGKGFWDAEELDGGSISGRGPGIAQQPFFPREAVMGALRTRKNCLRVVWLGKRGLRKCDLNPLVTRASLMQARRCCLRLQFAPRAAEPFPHAVDATTD